MRRGPKPFEFVYAPTKSLRSKEPLKITIGVPTKNRVNMLSHCLLAIAFQTYPIYEIIVVDDSDKGENLTENPLYEYIFRLLDEKGIKWKFVWGKRLGQHHSHQTVQEIAEGDFIYRCDDDCIMEPNCLEKLVECMSDDVGAVAPRITLPNPIPLPDGLNNDIRDIWADNIQWYKWSGVREVDHLYSGYLYRKGIVRFDLTLSNKAFREESIHSYSLKRAGYKLLVNGDALVHHFQGQKGGIRSDNRKEDYDHDQKIFEGYLNLWGITSQEKKFVVLDCGIGDHWAFKNILPELKKKHKRICIAACFPDVFFDEPDLEIISIADAKNMFGDIDNFQVYRLLIERKFEGKKITLIEAFKQLYL